jgi:uncharacterized membrane protein
VTVLTIGFMLLALALVLVVSAATSVHLDRKRLLAVADLAALDAADALDRPGYYAPGAADPGRPLVPLTEASVRAAVREYLDTHPDPHLGVVQVLEATTTDGRTVRVRLRAVVRPALLGGALARLPTTVEIDAGSFARAS